MFVIQVPMTTTEPPKPEVSDCGQTTHPPEYDIILHVRCYCPKGIEGRNIKCSITHGTQFEKTSRLDFTDEEVRWLLSCTDINWGMRILELSSCFWQTPLYCTLYVTAQSYSDCLFSSQTKFLLADWWIK